MKAFAELYTELEEATHSQDKILTLFQYFSNAPDDDAAWVIAFIRGDRPKRVISRTSFLELARKVSGLPEWLFDASLAAVADESETAALILPEPGPKQLSTESLAWWMENRIKHLPNLESSQQDQIVTDAWAVLSSSQRLVFNKLVKGTIRLRTDMKQLVAALSMLSGVSTSELTHRLSGTWIPDAMGYQALITPETSEFLISRPYPFRFPSERPIARKDLGKVELWRAEWKWNGKRAQLIRRAGKSTIWLKGELLIQDQLPELLEVCDQLPDGTVLDGEIVVLLSGQVQNPTALEKRLSRAPKPKDRKETHVAFIAFDLLEREGKDLRDLPLSTRLEELASLVEFLRRGENDPIIDQPVFLDLHPHLKLSKGIDATSWTDISAAVHKARELNAEGVIVKRLCSSYDEDISDWQKWLCEPLQVDAVLMYVEWVGGRNGTEECQYTVGLWKDKILVPIAKAHANLSSSEVHAINAFVRENTIERFGPVRTIKPEIVFRVEFDAIQASTRHKSGLVLKGPRIIKWHSHLTAGDVPALEILLNMLRG